MDNVLTAGLLFRPEILAANIGVLYTPDLHFNRKINFGGGSRLISGWTNFDSLFGVIVNKDIMERIPSGCIQSAYSSHFFEHITQKETLDIFLQVKRILVKGGVFRICAPDIEEFARQFSYESDYQRSWWKTVWKDKPDLLSIRDAFVLMGGNPSLDDSPSLYVGHVWPQSFGVIFWMLTIAGFDPHRIKRKSYGESDIVDVALYSMDNRSNHSFYIEATC